MKIRYVFLLVLIISTVVYVNSLHNPFHYDDWLYVTENISIKTISLTDIFLHPSSLFTPGTATGHYRPLVLLSYVINYRLSGLSQAGFHIGNLVFHIGSAFLVFLIVQGMVTPTLSLPRHQIRGGGKKGGGIALASALIFAVHPFNSEAVNYITARSTVMSGFFYLLAFYFWVRFRTPPPFHPPSPLHILPPQGGEEKGGEAIYRGRVREGVYFYLASLLAFILGMLSKEVAVTLPLVMLIYDFYFLPAPAKSISLWFKRRFTISLPIIPFILIVMIPYSVIRIAYWGAVMPSSKRPFDVQLYTELPALVRYLKLFIFPVGLNVDHYSEIYRTFFAWPVIASAMILVSFIALAVLAYRSKSKEWRVVSFFMVWFFIALLPTTLITLNVIFQEHRGYLAIIVFVVFAGVALEKFPAILSRLQFTIILVILLLLYGTVTIYRNSVWKDGVILWSDAVRKSPESSKAYINLGAAYARLGENEKAVKNFLKALRLIKSPTSDFLVDIHNNLGTVYQKMGSLDMAAREYRRVIELNPADFRPYYSLAVMYQEKGDTEAAIKEYKKVLKIRPADFRSYHNLGVLYQKQGDINLAEGFYKKAIDLNPDYGKSRLNLGVIYEEEGKLELAREEYIKILERDPNYSQAYYNLGELYEREGNLGMAIETYREAIKRNYGDKALHAHVRNLEERYRRPGEIK